MIEISDKTKCTGCTACKSICAKKAISMQEDNEGFLYPVVDKYLCVDCRLCEMICPISNDLNLGNSIVEAYAAHYKDDDEIWYQSASGGVFSAITDYVLSKKGKIYGACYNDKWEVVHDSANNKEDAIKFRDSKYVQSNLNDSFINIKQELNDNSLILFSGTPCQIAGLRSFLKKDYDNLLTVDLLCHCVPSPKVFRDYITYIETKYQKKIIKIHTKDKTLGWDKFQTPRIFFDDGTNIFNIDDSKMWETIFYSYLAVRPSCHTCKFANLHRVGDITIGDYWGVENQHPEFFNANGASIILINSKKGSDAFEEFSKKLVFARTKGEVALNDKYIYVTKPHKQRQSFWAEYDKLEFAKIINKYLGNTVKKRIISKANDLIGSPIKFIKRLFS